MSENKGMLLDNTSSRDQEHIKQLRFLLTVTASDMSNFFIGDQALPLTLHRGITTQTKWNPTFKPHSQSRDTKSTVPVSLYR